MDSKEKEEKLSELAMSVIENSKYEKEINYLFSKTGLTKDTLIQTYLDYDMDINAYENEIYGSLAMRFVLHLHNLLEGSWHLQRQKEVLDILKKMKNINKIADIGFGTPQEYIKNFILKNKKIKLTLIDLYDSAFEFGKILLGYWDNSWKNQISFKKLDMNTHEFVGKFDVYIFQDSIEHVENAKEYLKKTVKLSSADARFIFSLPIGPIFPIHTITWLNIEEIKKWLNECGLKVNRTKEIYMNPEVDLFAEGITDKFHEAVVECEKII